MQKLIKKKILFDLLNEHIDTETLINVNQSFEKVEQINIRNYIFFKIQELTYEEKAPRKEALENVLGSIRFKGINFLYLILGDENGVSFYLGIVKDKKFKGELELDIDDIGEKILKSSIESNFRGSKVIDLGNKKEELREKISSMRRFGKVTGVPIVNEENETFQGVDRLVDVMRGEKFGLFVIADPLSDNEMENYENLIYDSYDEIAPLSKSSVQATVSRNETVGSSVTKTETTTEGTSRTETSSNSHTEGETTGTSSNWSNSEGGSSYSNSKGGGKNSSKTKSDTNSTSVAEGSSSSESVGSSRGENKSAGTNIGSNASLQVVNKRITEWTEYIDEILLKRVKSGKNKGLYHIATYIFADEKGTLYKLGKTIQSIFSGIEENKAPLTLKEIDNDLEIQHIKNFQIPLLKFKTRDEKRIKQFKVLFSKSIDKSANWVSVNELSVIAGLPQKEVVGLTLKEEVEFGLNVKEEKIKKENKILLGNLVQSGNVLENEVFIDKENLNKHIFITGVTGSGKTTTCQRILNSAKTPFMVIEPVKTEYRILTEEYDDILIFTLGDERISPFRLNPLEIFEGESITSRIDMIKAIIESAFDMEAAIPQLIETALYDIYKDYGWDISTSQNILFDNPFADNVFAFPTLGDLFNKIVNVVDRQGFDERLKNDYIGSLRARLQGLLVGAKGLMLNTPRSIDFTDLLERNVIIELENIKNSSEKSLIMGFILINLNEALKIKFEKYKKEKKEFKHITLLEEAHRLLSKFIPGENPAKKLAIETITDMLAEVRKYGESLIIVDQIPNKLAPEVLKNTNTKIVHKIFAQDDKEAIGNTMALEEEQKEFLSFLETGRAIVYSQNFTKPVQVQIKQLEKISTTKSVLTDEKKIRKNVLLYYAQNYKKGLLKGLDLFDKKPTVKQIEELLSIVSSYEFNLVIEKWKKEFSVGHAIEIDNFKDFWTKNNLLKHIELLSKIIYLEFYRNRQSQAELIKIIKELLKTDNKKELTKKEQELLHIKI